MRQVAASFARLQATASRTRAHPHVALGVGAALIVAAEYGYQSRTSDAWLFLQAGVAFAVLFYAWRAQERLRLPAVLGLALVFQLALVSLHLGLDVDADKDSSVVFRWQGNGLLRGDYPRSEYPVGAVLLFGLEAWLGGGETRAANALLMIPFQLAIVAAVFASRARFGPWLAALVAFWPLNAYYWEFKFDLAPAALLAVGLLLALRGRWGWAGVALGLGAVVKWTPGLAFVALAIWLAASGRWRETARHAAGFALAALLYLPFLFWSPSEVLAAYTRQSGRSITPESVWYLLLRPLDLARVRTHISFSAGAPDWANLAAVALQVLLVLAVVGVAARLRGNLSAGVAAAAMAPVVFLLTNRIFSPQFIVLLFAAWGVAAPLLLRNELEQLGIGLAAMGASFGNAFVFPFALPYYDFTWPLCSAALFILGLGATGWIVARALERGAVRRASAPVAARAATAGSSRRAPG